MRSLTFILLLILANSVFAQKKYTFVYTVEGYTGSKAILKEIIGSQQNPLDSFKIENGRITFELDSGLSPGMYRIMLNDSIFTDFIFNNENISMQTVYYNMLAEMQVMESNENLILFNYWKYAISVKDSLARLSAEAQRAIRMDGGSPGKNFARIQSRVNQLNASVGEYAETLRKAYPELFAPVLLKAYQKPDYNAYMKRKDAVPYPNEKEFYRVHFFDNFDFSRPALVRTNVIYTAINDYFSNFGEPAATDNYIRNLDFILSKLRAGDEAYSYALELFLGSLEHSVFEDVYIHLIENHLAKFPKADRMILRRHLQTVEIIRRLKTGNYAPDAALTDTNGNSFLLRDVMSEAKLLFFWSPGCEHCEDLMPEIKEIYELYKTYGFEVIAFAVTPDAGYWKATLRKFNTKWINVSDLKGMESPVAVAYNIWMTPMLYVLDKNNKIIGRPRSIPEIHAKLLELLKTD